MYCEWRGFSNQTMATIMPASASVGTIPLIPFGFPKTGIFDSHFDSQ
jgi:hypothetical protein